MMATSKYRGTVWHVATAAVNRLAPKILRLRADFKAQLKAQFGSELKDLRRFEAANTASPLTLRRNFVIRRSPRIFVEPRNIVRPPDSHHRCCAGVIIERRNTQAHMRLYGSFCHHMRPAF
jgi:hypothetical protein